MRRTTCLSLRSEALHKQVSEGCKEGIRHCDFNILSHVLTPSSQTLMHTVSWSYCHSYELYEAHSFSDDDVVKSQFVCMFTHVHECLCVFM